MPPKTPRSLDDLSNIVVEEIKRRTARPETPDLIEIPEESHSSRPRFLIILAGTVLLAAAAYILTRGRVSTSPPSTGYAEAATSAFETALSAELETVTAEATGTDVPAPTPTLAAAIETPIPPPTAMEATVPPTNPWSAAIPEAACIPSDLPQRGRVVDVLSADTIRVLMDEDAHVYSVRYLGVELSTTTGAAFAQKALVRNGKLVYRKPVTLVRDITDADAGGILLRYVLVDNVFVNYDLIATGFALAGTAPPDTACEATFMTAEQLAQVGNLGIWAAPGSFVQP
jgi:endonuclease YncB( thermonuclease family)